MSRIVLIGCGKQKREGVHAARDLYTGPLFTDRLAYAEATGLPWWIISAGCGLLDPDQAVPSYDVTIADLPAVDRAAWALTVAKALLDELPDDARLREVVVELHAGADYAELLRDVFIAVGLNVAWPVQGLGIGEQRAFYARETRLAAITSRVGGS